MKKIFRSVFLVFLTLVFIMETQAFAREVMPLDEAVQQNKVNVEITGLGGSTGDTIKLNVRRNVPESLHLTLTPGTVFKSQSGGVQDMAGARIKGESTGPLTYIPRSDIFLSNNSMRSYIVEAYCLNFDKDNPGEQDTFGVAAPDDRTALIIKKGQEKGYMIQVIQSAIWMDRDKVSPSRLKSRFPVGDKEIGQATSLLAYVEQSIDGKLFVEATPDNATIKILNIRPKFKQGIMLEPGRYHVEVSANGYEKHSEWIELSPGEEKRMEIVLTAAP